MFTAESAIFSRSLQVMSTNLTEIGLLLQENYGAENNLMSYVLPF